MKKKMQIQFVFYYLKHHINTSMSAMRMNGIIDSNTDPDRVM